MAVFPTLAFGAVAVLIPAPAAGEAEPEAWIDDWYLFLIDTDGDGANDGFNNSLSLATDLEEVNVTVAMMVYRNSTLIATLSSSYTFQHNATTDSSPPWIQNGYWIAIEWSTNESGNHSVETLLYNENGTKLDDRTITAPGTRLVAPGRGPYASFGTLLDKTIVNLSVEPGNETTGFLNLTLNNTSIFTVDVFIQLFNESVSVSPSVLVITLNPTNTPNHSRTIPLTVFAPTGTQAGSEQVNVNVEVRDVVADPGLYFKRTLTFTANILPYSNLSLSAKSVAGSCPGNIAQLIFRVHNGGNMPDNIMISVVNRKSLEAKGFEIITPTLFTLEPGMNHTFLVELKIPQRSDDLPVNLTIEVRGNWTGASNADTVSVKLSDEGCSPPPALASPTLLVVLGTTGAVAAVRRRR